MSNSDFRGKEDQVAKADLSESEGTGSDNAFENMEEVLSKTAPPSSRTRAKRLTKKTGKQAAKDTGEGTAADSSGYVTSSPAFSKEYRDEAAARKKAKTGSSVQPGEVEQPPLTDREEMLYVGTEDWNGKARKGLKKLKYNSTNRPSGRRPTHGDIGEILQDPHALEPYNGSVHIRSEEFDQIANMIEAIKGGKKGESQLIEALAGLVKHVPDEERKPIEDMLINIRSHQQATAQHVLHQDSLVQELCAIVRRMGSILDDTSEQLLVQKQKTDKQERAAKHLRSKLRMDLDTVKESLKRKASMDAVPDGEDYKNFKRDFDRLTEDFAQHKEAAEAGTAEVAKVVADNKRQQDEMVRQMQSPPEPAATPNIDQLRRKAQQKRMQQAQEAQDRAEEILPAGQEQGATAAVGRPPVTFGPPSLYMDDAIASSRAAQPAPPPNIEVAEGVPSIRVRMKKSPPIPKKKTVAVVRPQLPPLQPPQQQPAQQVQPARHPPPRQEPPQQPYDWTQNPVALQARAREIQATQGEVVTHYNLPGRGAISAREYNTLPANRQARVRKSSWEVRANNPRAGNQHNQAKQGCFKCGGPHPKWSCPQITCRFCHVGGHMQDHCYQNPRATFGTKKDDKPWLYQQGEVVVTDSADWEDESPQDG